MARLRQAFTEDEIKRKGVADVRKAYNDLARDYNRIIDGNIYYCHRCNEFKNQDAFYNDKTYASGLFPECKECLLDEATDYDKKEKIHIDNREKTMFVFQKMDLPFYDSLYKSSLKQIKARIGEKNRSTAYQHMLTQVKSLTQYNNKHWCHSEFDSDDETIEIDSHRKARKEIKKIFGGGFTESDYVYLQDQYDDFKSRTQVDSKSQEVYVMQICLSLLEIDKDRKSGKDVTNKLKALDTLMNAANLQPKQNVSNAATDSLTFSQLIAKWELEKPIPEPDPELSDVSGIGKKIRVWFGGWLANALGLNTPQSQEYIEEINKYTVSKPTVEEQENNSAIYNKVFGSAE